MSRHPEGHRDGPGETASDVKPVAPRRIAPVGRIVRPLLVALGLALALPLFGARPTVAHAASGESVETDTRLEFERHGRLVARDDWEQLLARAKATRIRVYEPYEERTVEFSALALADVLDAVYGPGWKEEQELLFTCRDGYQPTVPVARLLEHRAWLAFGRPATETFSIRKHESGEVRTVDLGPYYVVWSNLDDATIRQEGDYGWPYQVVGIDLIDRRARFPKMAPPADASAEVFAGFEAFRIHCSKCHPVNGEGGAIGPELNPAPGSGEYYDPAWLRTWIEEPAKARPKTRMPPLNPNLPDRARVVDEIVAYLTAMSAVPPAGGDAAPGNDAPGGGAGPATGARPGEG